MLHLRVVSCLSLLLGACSDPFNDNSGDAGPDARTPDAVSDTATDTFTPGDAQVTPGDPETLLLRGAVVTPAQVLASGEVLTHQDTILCVAASCAGEPEAAGATVIDTGGIIYPGLIDSHNHTQYNYLPQWKHAKMYTNHNQWQAATDYKDFTSLHHQLEGTLMCEMIKYGEIRSLLAGTTMIQGTPSRKCADTLIRNADLSYHGFGTGDTVRTNVIGTSVISQADATSLLDGFASGKTTAYVIHLAEGIDETARKEFDALESFGLLKPQVVVIHGTALGQPELTKMKAAGMPLIWSPSSNLDLYGATNDIVAAWNIGLTVALAPDWTPSGEPNILDELHVAAGINKDQLGGLWKPEQLVAMVTTKAADVLHFEKEVGALKKGLHADVLVLAGDAKKPYQALISARLPQVRLVVVRGKALYGDPALMQKLEPNAYCESISVCGGPKVICVKEKETDATNQKLAQSLGEIENSLGAGYTPGVLPLATNCP
jgi:cytosine/adenosine deaminase-related metal-dependent hydrolase